MKELRNTGQCYTTKKGITKPARQVRELGICRKKCKELISFEEQQALFSQYLKLGTYELRQAFTAGLMDVVETKTVTKIKSDTNPRKRMHTYKYFLPLHGNRIAVCQNCFRKTLGESEQFLKTVARRKIEHVGSFCVVDGRGKHANSKKLSQERVQKVIDFIREFPTYESHYTRRDTSKRYLPSDLSVAQMYRLYCERDGASLSLSKFCGIFKTLNLKFKKPKIDTCHKCDVLKAKIEVSSEDERSALMQEQSDHHKEVDVAYESKKNDKEKADSNTSLKVFCFDLQQCLPTPFLRTSVAFYKRPLWTFNLTVHDCTNNQPVCYMWHEALAKRGGNEIASCVFSHLRNLTPSTKHVIFYSDCCPGQNKNTFIASMFTTFMQLETNVNVNVIDHKFLVPGHTHMECDSDHALIEKKKKSTMVAIHHPRDWFQFVRTVGIRKTFIVKEIQQSEIFDFSAVSKERYLWRKVDDNGNKYNWRDIKWLRFTKEFGTILFKTTLSEDETFKTINLKRRGINSIKLTDLKQCYSQQIIISKNKKKDLLDMLPLVDTLYHNFYKNLQTEDMDDIHPDLTQDNSNDLQEENESS